MRSRLVVDSPDVHRSHKRTAIAFATSRALVSLTLLAGVSTAQSQPSRQIAIPAQFTTIGEPIESISGLRELSDGTVLLSDSRAKQLLALAVGRSNRQIGRVGDGPQEYRSVSAILRLPGDSSVLVDGVSRRWFFLIGTQIVRSAQSSAPRFGHGDASVSDADSAGRHLAVLGYASRNDAPGVRYPQMIADADSLLVLRGGRADGRLDTLARIRGGFKGQRLVKKVFKGMSITYFLGALPPTNEQAVMCRDGAIALALLSPPRIEFIPASGDRRTTASLSVERIPINSDLQNALIRERFGAELAPLFAPSEFPNWPSELPPFGRGALSCTARGEAVLERASKPGGPRLYDVVARTGTVLGRFTLSRSDSVAGFGERTLYVAHRDGDDLLEIRRYAWNLR